MLCLQMHVLAETVVSSLACCFVYNVCLVLTMPS